MQAEHDVVLLFCHAVPALKAYMKAVKAGNPPKLPNPHHFKQPQPLPRLKAISRRYRKVVGRMLFIASFSYFEAYFKDLLKEAVEFHGGVDRWCDTAKRRSEAAVVTTEAQPLSEPKKGTKLNRYRKHIDALAVDPGFQFPSERLAAFGVQKLAESSKELRAVEIEEIATKGLGLPILGDEWEVYQEFRNDRNEIAHGRSAEVDLGAAIEAARHLSDLAKRIDDHVVRHFMLIEDARSNPRACKTNPESSS